VSRGRYLSLREARKKKRLERFTEEHPSQGDEKKLDAILDAMAKKPESDDQTSPKGKSED
jgi:hypothetical protein